MIARKRWKCIFMIASPFTFPIKHCFEFHSIRWKVQFMQIFLANLLIIRFASTLKYPRLDRLTSHNKGWNMNLLWFFRMRVYEDWKIRFWSFNPERDLGLKFMSCKAAFKGMWKRKIWFQLVLLFIPCKIQIEIQPGEKSYVEHQGEKFSVIYVPW